MGETPKRIRARQRDLGGMAVGRVLPAGRLRTVGPFIFLDHMGPVELPPGRGIDVPPHPHIGLATVTYLFEGELVHRDSLGTVQVIRPGDVNWMTAGRGIVHSERSGPEDRAGTSRLHGLQSWVALPRAAEDAEPEFAHYPSDRLPMLEHDGATLTLVAGETMGMRSPVAVASPTLFVDVRLRPGGSTTIGAAHFERAVYVASGSVRLDGQDIDAGTLVVLTRGDRLTLVAADGARAVLLGGAPLDGERHIWWNFVSSDPDRIEKAKRGWKAGRFDPVPGESESVPLPER
ncbi:MAG: pirin family protein [Gammaproteobacteria bacterium]